PRRASEKGDPSCQERTVPMASLSRPSDKVNEGAKRPPQPAYVCIAREVLLNPPIKHRHTPKGPNYLAPAEVLVALAAIGFGSMEWMEARHAQARERSGAVLKERWVRLQRNQAARAKGHDTKLPFNRDEWEMTHLLASGDVPTDKQPMPIKTALK